MVLRAVHECEIFLRPASHRCHQLLRDKGPQAYLIQTLVTQRLLHNRDEMQTQMYFLINHNTFFYTTGPSAAPGLHNISATKGGGMFPVRQSEQSESDRKRVREEEKGWHHSWHLAWGKGTCRNASGVSGISPPHSRLFHSTQFHWTV